MLFDQFKQLLSLATTSVEFMAKNAIMQDVTFAELVADQIATLSKDYNIKLNTSNVLSVSGLAASDTLAKEIKFTPKGTEKLAQGYLERNIENPTKIWVRPDATDGRRYVITDSVKGVLFAGENGELLGALPGFGTVPGYSNAESAITFTVSATEYIAVAMPTHNVVRIFNMSTFAVVATIGVYGTPGLPGTSLHTPKDLAFNSTTNTLYICSDTGVGTGGTGAGYVVSYNLTTPASPVFGSFLAVNAGESLLHGQVNAPTKLAFDPDRLALWIASEGALADSPEVGALAVVGLTSPGYLVGFVETRGSNYDLASIKGMWLGSDRKLYLGSFSIIEVFDTLTFKHNRSYGKFTTEDTATITSRDLELQFSSVSSIAFDTVTVDGTEVTTLLVADAGNRRLLRFSENTFDADSYVTFNSQTFDVPVAIQGYLVQGSIPASSVGLEYRTSDIGAWQTLSAIDVVPGSLFLQFRLKMRLSSEDIINEASVKQIVIIGEVG